MENKEKKHSQNKRWVARIKVRGDRISLGLYDDVSSAHRAYAAAAKKYFGEFAKTE
jgi:hypothetical protein